MRKAKMQEFQSASRLVEVVNAHHFAKLIAPPARVPLRKRTQSEKLEEANKCPVMNQIQSTKEKTKMRKTHIRPAPPAECHTESIISCA